MLPQASISMVVAIRPLPLALSIFLLAVSARVSVSTLCAQGVEFQSHLTPHETLLYRDARTLIDWTPEQIHAVRELRELRPAESQQDLQAILHEVGNGSPSSSTIFLIRLPRKRFDPGPVPSGATGVLSPSTTSSDTCCWRAAKRGRGL